MRVKGRFASGSVNIVEKHKEKTSEQKQLTNAQIQTREIMGAVGSAGANIAAEKEDGARNEALPTFQLSIKRLLPWRPLLTHNHLYIL